MFKIAHIANPFLATGDQLRIQKITVESIKKAAEQASGHTDVKLYSAQFEEDLPVIPDFFIKTPFLDRSILDVRSFNRPKKYPFIKDIIRRLYDSSDAEWFIYTNMDIILQPHFYQAVTEYLQKGYDSLIINRRRIPDVYTGPEDLPQIFRQKGRSHPGFDCFVFRRDLVPEMVFENIIVGIPFVEATLAHNLFAFSKNLLLLDDVFLTVHLGMEIMPKRDPEYYWHNRKEFFKKVKPQLWEHLDPQKIPYGNLPLPLRYLNWALNPSLFTFMNFKLELRKFKNNIMK